MRETESYSTLIFDLDNTLFNEFYYLDKAYQFIGRSISDQYPEHSSEEIYNFLKNEFRLEGRKDLYQKTISRFNIKKYPLKSFLNGLRAVPIKENSLQINPEVQRFIESNVNYFTFFIVTNGNEEQQKNKIRAIRLPYKDRFNVIFCDSFGVSKRKPDPFSLNHIIDNYEIRRNDVLFIGDSREDLLAAQRSNIDFIFISDFLRKYRS